MNQPLSHVYYFDLGEGRWDGDFSFEITDFKEFLKSKLSLKDRALALMLHTIEKVPGRAVMKGEISGDPTEAESGVARVDVTVHRFGLEIYRLSGYYKLTADGTGVEIRVRQRFGPYGFPLENEKSASALISDDGYHARYDMKILGQPFVGEYQVSEDGLFLDAEYTSDWGVTREVMRRVVPKAPRDPDGRRRYDAMLDVARDVERLGRKYDRTEDERAVFAQVYSHFLRDLAFTIERSNYRDPDWVVRLAKVFAHLFVKAMAQVDQGGGPKIWRTSLAAAKEHGFAPTEEMALFMLVHVMHDLPFALLKVGLRSPDGDSHIEDYGMINNVLQQSLDVLQERLAIRYDPAMAWIDSLGGSQDEMLAGRALAWARTRAWYDAERLAAMRPLDRHLRDIEKELGEIIDLLAGPRVGFTRRALRRGWRKLRRFPRRPQTQLAPKKLPPSDESKALIDPEVARATALYSAHTLRGLARKVGSLDDLIGDGLRRLQNETLTEAERKAILPLLQPLGWAEALELGVANGAKWTLAALAPDVVSGVDLDRALQLLGVKTSEVNALTGVKRSLVHWINDGFDTAQDILQEATESLDALGLPASTVVRAFDDQRGGYEPATDSFFAAVASYFQVEFDDVKWIVEPQNWAKVIEDMISSNYIEAPIDGRGVIREVVNILYPWVRHNPLHLVTDLNVTTTEGPDFRKVDYNLVESHDGTFKRDEGFIEARRLGNKRTLVRVEKRIVIDENPLLYTMLRSNPDGLAWILSRWIDGAADQGSHPSSP